jgi:hypothetical protein
MKKTLLVLLVVSMFPSFAWTQEDAMTPPIPPRRSKAAKVGAFGGFTPGWLFVDPAPINSFLQAAGGAPLSDAGVPMLGGGGAAYIMLVPNLRVGGLGMGGDISSTSLSSLGVRRDAKLSAGFGGVTVEYVLPIVERLDVAVGGMLGGGGIDITLREDVGGNKTWNQEWGNFGTGNYQIGGQINNITRKLSGSYFVWIPSLNVEYAVMGWGGLRLGVSYVGMSSPSWKLDDKYDLLGVPSDVNGQGWMINAGILVGTF